MQSAFRPCLKAAYRLPATRREGLSCAAGAGLRDEVGILQDIQDRRSVDDQGRRWAIGIGGRHTYILVNGSRPNPLFSSAGVPIKVEEHDRCLSIMLLTKDWLCKVYFSNALLGKRATATRHPAP